jgi:Ca2+-binding EF-hand superfamily protein
MKKIASLLAASALFSMLTACGSANMNAAVMPNRAPVAQPNTAVQAQSLTGIYKQITQGAEAAFKAQDKDGNGFITPNEFNVSDPDTFMAFDKLDGNNDGKLSKGEFTPGFFSRAQDVFQIKAMASFLFDQLDRNNDKKLSRQEASASFIPGVAPNYDKFLSKPMFSSKPLDYLRKTDFENLVAFAMTNPAAAGGAAPTDPAAATR